MKKQYINPTVAIYAVANAQVICSSELGYGGTEENGVANGKRHGITNFSDFDDDEE